MFCARLLFSQSCLFLRKRVCSAEAFLLLQNTGEPGYNDIGLHDTPSITSDILWYPPVEMWWHTVTNGKGSDGETGEWSG